MLISITCDTSLLAADIENLRLLVGGECLVNFIEDLRASVVIGERRTTVGPDGIKRLVLFPRLSDLDRLRAALRAGEKHDAVDSTSNTGR
jgi:hypothetical protein